MKIFYHSKDLDGVASGAILKIKYPEAEMIGFDYSDSFPDFETLKGEEIIFADVTIPFIKMQELGTKSKVTVLDHHVGFWEDYQDYSFYRTFEYVYESKLSACEIVWKFCFPEKTIPLAVELLGRYDTWRTSEGDWDDETLPFQYYVRKESELKLEKFPSYFFENTKEYKADDYVRFGVSWGKNILQFQQQQDEILTKKFAFEARFGELKALCINTYPFSLDTLKSHPEFDNFDIYLGFQQNEKGYTVSLRTNKENVNCMEIAKTYGGGGHVKASGFFIQDISWVI